MNDKKILTESELYNQGARYCSVAEHCLSEVRAKLMRTTDDEALIGKVLGRLVENGYINERRYAQAFVHDKFRFAKWGKWKIQQALRSKGISETDYLPALEELE
ncbi:MAG: RecX family transcriptional regulator, partial [Bacteroidaceae bacterium]|nr:RecX family transcriptional regulator [Bacteroidaceae bacterium]